MSGTSSVPNTFASQVGLVPASQLDANWSAITAYINLREVSSGTLAARPVGVGGQWYYASDSATLFFHSGSTGGSWIPVASAPATTTFNVRSYGATGDGVTDDTTAIQTAINAAVAAGGGTVYLPAGAYQITRLNLTGITVGLILRGDGINATRFQARTGTAAYGTTTGHLFDCTGAQRLVFQDFQVGAFDQTPEPTTAFFIAASSILAGDQIQFRGVHITGKYTVATLYVYGVASSQINSSSFWNYKAGAGVFSAGTFTATNVSGLASSFATIATGTASTSDWSGQGVEFHKLPGAGATGAPLLLDAVGNLTFVGGNLSGGATNYVQLYGTSVNLSFVGTTFQTEGEPVTPTNLLNLPTSASLIGFALEHSTRVLGGDVVAGGGVLQAGPSLLPFNNGATTLGAVSTQKWIGIGIVTTDLNAGMIAMPYAAIVNAMQAVLSSAPGAGLSRTFTLQHNGASTTLTATVTGAATTSAMNSSAYVQVAAGAKLLVDSGATGASVPADTHAYISFRALPLT